MCIKCINDRLTWYLTRTIFIYNRGNVTTMDKHDINGQFMMTSSNGNIFRVTGPLCGEFTGLFPSQRPVTRSFDVFFDLCQIKRLSKQWWGWWFESCCAEGSPSRQQPLAWVSIHGDGTIIRLYSLVTICIILKGYTTTRYRTAPQDRLG